MDYSRIAAPPVFENHVNTDPDPKEFTTKFEAILLPSDISDEAVLYSPNIQHIIRYFGKREEPFGTCFMVAGPNYYPERFILDAQNANLERNKANGKESRMDPLLGYARGSDRRHYEAHNEWGRGRIPINQ